MDFNISICKCTELLLNSKNETQLIALSLFKRIGHDVGYMFRKEPSRKTIINDYAV